MDATVTRMVGSAMSLSDEITTDERDKPRSSTIGPATSSAAVRLVAAPFNNQYGDADLILRSSQGLDFYVHKPILRIASEFFSTMLSLPQPSSSNVNSELDANPDNGSADAGGSTRLPVVAMSEDSRCLWDLLCLCYPPAIARRRLKSVAEVSSPLAAAQKYQMAQVVGELTVQLQSFCDSHPLEVFAEAFYRNLDEVAVAAAISFVARRRSHSLGRMRTLVPLPIDHYSTCLDDVPASWYCRLLEYHIDRSASAKKKGGHSGESPALIHKFDAPHRFLAVALCGHGKEHNTDSTTVQHSHAFCDPLHTDAVIRSSDGIDFWILRGFLRYSSTVFEQMLGTDSSLTTAESAGENTSTNRLLDLPEEGRTLALLFQLCYPMADPELTSGSNDDDLHDLYHLAEAAQKYKVARAVEFAKRALVSKASSTCPLRLYFIASQKQWEDCMEVAAIHCVYELADQYSPEMEMGSTAVYRRLLVYRRKCRDIILAHYDSAGIPRSTPPALYWSTTPWLNEPGDAKFWLAVHKRARDNIAAGQEPCLDSDALFPKYLRLTSPNSEGASDSSIVRTGITMSKEIIVQIARALAEVCIGTMRDG